MRGDCGGGAGDTARPNRTNEPTMNRFRDFLLANPAECLCALAIIIAAIFVAHTLITC